MTLPYVVKPEAFHCICKVDTEELRNKLLSVGEAVWNAEDSRKENKFDCFRQTRHIIARFIPLNQDPMAFYSTPFWSVWQPVLQPILKTVAASFNLAEVEFPKVMLARLAAGGVIEKHIDGAGSNLLTHKIHVPLVTNDQVWFEAGSTTFRLEPGFAYELNNIRPHGVRNEGATDRIHLIFEMLDRARYAGARPSSEAAHS